jgi:hypothetical protein
MAQQQGGDQIDDTTMLLLLLVGASGFGLFSVASFLAPVQTWLVEHGVLVAGESVLLGWGEGNVGLDLGRLVIAGGVLLLLLLLAVVVIRKRVRRDV